MKKLALIPARSGSKRLPNKNFMDIDGKIMVKRTIEMLQASELFEEIVISSDSEKAKEIASREGITFVERNVQMSDDYSSVDQVCTEFIKLRENFDVLCCVYPTAILLKNETLKKSFEFFLRNNLESLMGASKYNFNPVQAFQISSKGTIQQLFPEWSGKKSQLFPETCASNGTFYWSTFSHLATNKSLISNQTRPFYIPDEEVSDINTFEDLERAISLVKIKSSDSS